MLIGTYDDAVGILKDPAYLNARHAAAFDRLRHRTGAALRDTEDFFRDWLMYMDGPGHKSIRTEVVSILRGWDRPYSATPDVERAIALGRIDDAWIDQVVSAWHGDMFGLSTGQQHALFERCAPLLRFLLHRETDHITELDQCVRELLSWMTSEHFDDRKVIAQLLRKKVPLGTIVNLVIDSYEPVKVSLSNTLYIAGQTDPRQYPPRVFIMECLRLLPPFRFINRLDPASGPSGAKVSIDLMQCNRDAARFPDPMRIAKRPVPSLAFGKGAHACPGFSLAHLFLSAIWTDIRAGLDRDGLYIRSTGREDNDHGLCRILDLSVDFVAEPAAGERG